MTVIPEGYALIGGRSPATARAVLAAADAAGVDQTLVRTTRGGYLVPVAVADHYTSAGDGTPEAAAVPVSAVVDAPTSDWKNADIETWAVDHGVDLGGATKKADMLAAIAAANKEG